MLSVVDNGGDDDRDDRDSDDDNDNDSDDSDDGQDLARAFPHVAPREADAAVVTALVAESEQLVENLAPTLLRMLELVPGPVSASSILGSTPQLRLKFFPTRVRREWSPPEIPGILRASALLMAHSQRLDAFPTLKMQFWLDVLQSHMSNATTRDVHKNQLMEPGVPQFVVDFGVAQQRPNHTLSINSDLEEALVEFLTATAMPASKQKRLSVGFAFTARSLRVKSLETLERILDRSFWNPMRHFNVKMLDVSDNLLMPEDLEVLARIVRKCVVAYGVEELRMDKIIPSVVNGARRDDWVCPETTPAPLLEIARTVFCSRTLRVLASQPFDIPNETRSLRRVSMSDNNFCREFYAARFSALRYGGGVEEDVTKYMARSGGNENPAHYWRWFAFGLFYPRPKRFARHHRLRLIGQIQYCPQAVKTFAKTLRNPASELLFDGRDIGPMTELFVCVVCSGTIVEVIQPGGSNWTDTIPKRCELEAIYERADGAMCVVLPGVGLGWIHSEFIDRIEREPRVEQCGLYNSDLGWRTNTRGGALSMISTKDLDASMMGMVEMVGRQFYALQFGDYPLPSQVLRLVWTHCPHLTQVKIFYPQLTRDDEDALLQAISSQLKVLDFWYGTKEFYTRLFYALRQVPGLRELRLHGAFRSSQDLVDLENVLRVNHNLTRVHVMGLASGLTSTTMRLDRVYHGQWLSSTLTMATKIAFLSVVQRRTDPLDEWVLAHIFGFVVDHRVRRALVWKDEIRPTGDIW